MCEWQKHSQESIINLCGQASESLPIAPKGSNPSSIKKHLSPTSPLPRLQLMPLIYLLFILFARQKNILSIHVHASSYCHDQNFSTLKSNKVCMNCLKPGYFVKHCKSLHHCKACQKPHHTLLHIDNTPTSSTPSTVPEFDPKAPLVSSNTAANLAQNLLLITCRVLIEAPDSSTVKARALYTRFRLILFVCLRTPGQGPLSPSSSPEYYYIWRSR